MGFANIAATNMEHLCTCPEHGYSQYGRFGQESLGTCVVECEGHTSYFFKGDRDCSSAIIDCWQEAFRGTQYEGILNGATYTGNMRSVFVNSGLFEWKPMSFYATRGDIYLNEVNHTAMCLCGDADNDILGEFSISENGTIDGEPGDQTSYESYIHWYYDYPWDGILHYIGNDSADTYEQDTTQNEPNIDELANAVINGEYGNGDERREKLGDLYDKVQAKVNEILGSGSNQNQNEPNIDELAYAVINGDYGNGDERREKLGDLYDTVQARVNELLN